MRTEQVIKWIIRSTFYHAHFWTPHYFNASGMPAKCTFIKKKLKKGFDSI